MKKLFISLVVVFLIGFLSIFFIASRPTTSEAGYYHVKSYQPPSISSIPDTLTVMTYNVGYLSGMSNNLPVEREYQLFSSNLERLVQLIDQVQPEIIGLQEVDFAASRSFDQNQLDSIAIRNGFGFGFKSINWDKRYVPFPYWPVKRQFGRILSGQAILSRLPISNDTTIRLIKPVNSSFLYNAFYLDRLVQLCEVKVGTITMKVINLHLEAFDEETRVQQAHVVRALFEKFADRMPVLLMGDFNSRHVSEEESAEAMKIIMEAENIASAITDSTYREAPENFYTFSSRDPYQMIDYILYNENYIERLEGRIVREAGEISDHLPVLMKFIFKGEN